MELGGTVIGRPIGRLVHRGTGSRPSVELVEVLPLGLQAHLFALLPPELPAPLEVHFLHGCDLRAKRDIVSTTPVSRGKRRQTVNDTVRGQHCNNAFHFRTYIPPLNMHARGERMLT